MKYVLYRPEELSAEQWQIYAALRDARRDYDNPFFDPDFARLVGEVRSDTRIGFASDGDGVFAVWPMHVRPGNWARPVGSPFSDWNGPILGDNVELSFQEILAGFDLSGFTTGGLLPRPGVPSPGMRRIGSHVTDLSAGFERYLAEQQRRWPKHFKKISRVYRNIERDFSEMRHDRDDRTDTVFQRLIELKRAQYVRTGRHDVLKAPWVNALFDRLRHFEGARLRARLMTLYLDGVPAACDFDLQSDTVLHSWITVYDPQFKAYSPGQMLMHESLQNLSENGIRIFDSGPGHDHYKRTYANLQVPIDVGVIPGTTANLSPSRVAGRAWQLGEQVMPNRARHLMARVRRRMDQIAAVETTLSGRASGVLSAISHRPD